MRNDARSVRAEELTIRRCLMRLHLLPLLCTVLLIQPLAWADNTLPERICGTRTFSDTERAEREARFRLAYAGARSGLRTTWSVGKAVTIPVWFHMMYKFDSDNRRIGFLSRQTIQSQVDVMNKAYRGSGFQFRLAGISRTENATWFDGCLDDGSLEETYKPLLAKNPARYLNMYSCDSSSGTLGYAYFPSDGPEGDYHHGVVLKYNSLPGGVAPFGEGITAVHEVGHYLGLYHTFEGACSVTGDEVGDTPSERRPAYGCSVYRDTCGGRVGKDPVSNYMDYSDDSCLNTFSIGQIERMQQQVTAYRPGLLE